LIERRIRKTQGEFNFDSLPAVDIDKAGTGTAEPAALFVSFRSKLPTSMVCDESLRLASSNVEQFLSLSGTLFDRLLTAGI